MEQEKDLIDLQIEEEALAKKIKESKEKLHQLKVDIDIGTIRERDLEDIVKTNRNNKKKRYIQNCD